MLSLEKRAIGLARHIAQMRKMHAAPKLPQHR